MAGKGGGAWKVAYADFVTAMMAFFMVMWLVGQNAETKEAVQEYFQHPTVRLLPAWISQGPHADSGTPHKNDGEDPGPEDGTGSKKNRPQKRIRAEDVRHARLLMRTDGDQTVVGSLISFDPDSATLSKDSKAELDQLLPILAGKTNRIELRGHTARRSILEQADFADEWQLSFARAVAVMKYLENAGIESQRMRLSQAASYEAPPDAPENAPPQSRVEVYVLSEFIEAQQPDVHQPHSPHFDDYDEGDSHGNASHGGEAAASDASHGNHTKPTANAATRHKSSANSAYGNHGGSHGAKKPAAKSTHGGHSSGHGAKKPASKPSHAAKKPAKSSHGGH